MAMGPRFRILRGDYFLTREKAEPLVTLSFPCTVMRNFSFLNLPFL